MTPKGSATIKTAGLIAYGLSFTGLFLIMLGVLGSEVWQWPVWIAAFVRDVGLLLAAVMGGTILHEKLLRDEAFATVVDELDRKLEARIPKLAEIAHGTATEVHTLFAERPPTMKGIHFLHDRRRNYSAYYSWVNEQNPQDLFFAGRSVLHRIDADIKTRGGASAEEVILRKLKEGSRISIAFLDPRTNILDRLAREEGQKPEAMLGDIATSVGICRRLFALLQENFAALQPGSFLAIRVFDRVPYFAYNKQDDQMIVGFYFASDRGDTSAAYELVDDHTKQVFSDHFGRIMADAAQSTVVEFDGARGRPSFDEHLFHQLYDHLCLPDQLGREKTDELFGDPPVGRSSASNLRMEPTRHCFPPRGSFVALCGSEVPSTAEHWQGVGHDSHRRGHLAANPCVHSRPLDVRDLSDPAGNTSRRP